MFFKCIIQGRLEFGTSNSYDKVYKMFAQRVTTYYKTDVIFKQEDIFSVEDLSLEIPRYVGQVSEKSFKITTNLLEYCVQFAVAGSIRAWLINEGKVMSFITLEPNSDKGAVQSFVKGRNLVKVKGKEQEALDALSKAIERFDRHAQAYERRAKVNFFMKNFHDALRDYNKCIGIDPTIPTAYYGKAKIHMLKEEWDEAIYNLEETLKKSLALQTLYWKSRRLKAQCHIQLKQWDKALFDLNLFCNRKFEHDNPNRAFVKWSLYNLGVVHFYLENYLEAIKCFDKVLDTESIDNSISEGEIYYYRGVSKKNAGKNGAVKDLKMALSMGYTKANSYL